MLTANETRGADSIAALARESYRGITLYSAAGGRCDVDLSDNTNLWGAPPAALRALANVGVTDVARYPRAYEPALASTLADYAGVSLDMESNAAPDLRDGLAALGHQFASVPDSYMDFGAGQFIVRSDAGYIAGSDPRRDGQAAGY